jgi:hypothetical protein
MGTASTNSRGLFRPAWLPALATLLLLAGFGCRRYSPLPPPATDGAAVMTGGTGGRGTGGTGSTGGTGGSRPDTNPPDVAPTDVGPLCGKAAQACCPGNRCLDGGCCEEGVCTSHGNSCQLEMSASCLNSKCSNDCGGPGIRCCGGPKRNCTFPLTICEGPNAGICVACGGLGQPCCRDNYCTDKNVMCIGGRCGGGPPPSDAGPDTAIDAPLDVKADAPKG